MAILALDVDGVLLDPERDGHGHWTNELTARFGIERTQIRSTFFATSWADVVNGRRTIEDALGESLAQIDPTLDVDEVLSCWFDADYVPIARTFDLASRAAHAGHRVVLATNQEHRRAAYLRERIGSSVPLDDVIYSADVGHQKHDPRFFEAASTRLGVGSAERGDVIFVDDAIANVEIARTSGWRAVHASSDPTWYAEVERVVGLEREQR